MQTKIRVTKYGHIRVSDNLPLTAHGQWFIADMRKQGKMVVVGW